MSSINLSQFERLCLLGRALHPDRRLPLCIQGWSIPAGPQYRALYVELRDDNLIVIPLNDEGKPDKIQIHPVALLEPGDVNKVIQEAQRRSTGQLCHNCSRTPQLRRKSDQHFLVEESRHIVPSDSSTTDDDIPVIIIISPSPSPAPDGLPTTQSLQSHLNSLNGDLRHTSPPDVVQSNIPIIHFTSPSPPPIDALHASTSTIPVELQETPRRRGHSLAPPSPSDQYSTPGSHHTMLSPAPSSPYGGGSPQPQPQPTKTTARSSKIQATSSKNERKRDTNTPRRNVAKSGKRKGRAASTGRKTASKSGKRKGKAASTGRKTGSNLSATQLARRQEIETLAMAIVTVKNSPLNKHIDKHALHQKVADDIVRNPPNHWINLIAVKTSRAPDQVGNWFNNRKQRLSRAKSTAFEYEEHVLPSGERAEMARHALLMAQSQNFSWTDEQFERVLDDWWSRIPEFYPQLKEREKTIPHYSCRV